MENYLLFFIPSIIFLKIYSIFSIKKRMLSKVILSLLVVLPLAIMAGLRDGIGTDFFSYQWVFQNASTSFMNNDFSPIFTSKEPLYGIVELISFSIQGTNYHFFLFLVSLLTLLPVFFFIVDIVPQKYITLSWLIYLIVYFLTSFNIMRQMLALSLVIYSFKFLIHNNRNKYFLGILIASLMHNTAIISFAFYYLNYDISFNDRFPIKEQLKKIIGLMIPIIFILSIAVGTNLPIIGEYFLNYGSIQNNSNSNFIIFMILPIIPALFFRNKIKKLENGGVLYGTMVLSLVFAIIANFNEFAFRLMYYSTSVILYLYPVIISKLKKRKYIFSVFLILYLVIISVFVYDVFRFNDVIPAKFVSFEKLLRQY